MNVYFRDSYGKRRLLEANVKDKEAVWKIIQKFLDDHNYKSYYTRIWYSDGYTWYDVGSHTEYFLVDEDIMEQYENEQEEETGGGPFPPEDLGGAGSDDPGGAGQDQV